MGELVEEGKDVGAGEGGEIAEEEMLDRSNNTHHARDLEIDLDSKIEEDGDSGAAQKTIEKDCYRDCKPLGMHVLISWSLSPKTGGTCE
jgi:hypothetical protein